MGAYLSTPVTDKKSDDFLKSDKYVCGLSGMQGWRISMEDAYNCMPRMDDDTGFFAVYDGHGGGEVAIYCSHHFIGMLKDTEEYKEGKIDAALKTTFMEIDKKLREPHVVKELKLLSQMEPGDLPVTEEDINKMEEQEKQEKEEVEDETKLLYEEATMSIEELLAKYGRVVNETEEKLKSVINKDENQPAESSKLDESDDTEVAETDKSEDSQDETQEKQSKATGDAKKESEETEKDDKVNEAGDKRIKVVKKKLQKEFLKVKPSKSNDEEDSEEDDDYEGFESDEAVEGSSSEDDDDDDVEDEEEEEEGAEDNEQWMEEKRSMNEGAMRAGVEEPGVDSGSTAVVAVLRDTDLYVANAGDSRCVLGRKNGVAFDMSDDHKPEDECELSRITTAGGHVNTQGRVNGGLNLSRAIGDHLYKTNSELPLEKQMITALPDVRHVTLEPGDEFIVIACDGIWNVLSSQEVVDFIRARLYPECQKSTDNGTDENETSKKPDLSTICEELFQRCLAPDTTGDGTGCDNMTCIIVEFKQDWLKRRNLARAGEEVAPSLSENNEKTSTEKSIDVENSQNAKADSKTELAKPKIVEDIIESKKRSITTSDDPKSCLNGDNGPVKRVKLD